MATETRPEAPAGDAYNYTAFTRSSTREMSAAFRNRVRVGEPAPDFALTALDGTTVRLADLRGQYVVLEFGSIT